MRRKSFAWNKFVPISIFVFFLIVQVKTVNLKNTYSFTPSEIDQQIQRMNYYPPKLARLGYILEKKREVRLIEKYVENFIEVVDFNTYFPNYFPLITLPLFLFGIYKYFSRKFTDTTYALILSFSVFMQSFFGTRGKIGPILVLSFIAFFVLYGINEIIILVKKYVKK